MDNGGRGLTVEDLAKRFRVSPDKVRGWIRSGKLRAFDRSDGGGRPKWVVTPEALAEFERGRTSRGPEPKPARRKRTAGRDYFPD